MREGNEKRKIFVETEDGEIHETEGIWNQEKFEWMVSHDDWVTIQPDPVKVNGRKILSTLYFAGISDEFAGMADLVEVEHDTVAVS